MKRNKLNEINKIKNLINLLENRDLLINEQSEEEIADCKDKLERAGYDVYGSGYQSQNSEYIENNCYYKDNLKNLLSFLENQASDKYYKLSKQGNNCYILLESEDTLVKEFKYGDGNEQLIINYTNLNIPISTIIFFGDGDMIISYILDDDTIESHGSFVINGVEKYGFISSLLYGTYEVDDNGLEFKNLEPKYIMSYDENKKTEKIRITELGDDHKEHIEKKGKNIVNSLYGNFNNFKDKLKKR
jgi:hypothetical protein